MLKAQFILPLAAELVVDLFAGGGGASTGIEQAIGRHVDIAINHDPEAVALHAVNHPQTKHFVSDVFEVDPGVVTEGHPVGLLWASPDCKHFSKAKGSKPVSKKIRSLAWVVVKWCRHPTAAPRMVWL
jgi:DNA (cytosine-5)-methyltransferase 1